MGAVNADRQEVSSPSMVERVTLILDAFEQRPTSRLNLDQIASRASLPRSTTHRILAQLVKLQWLERGGAQYSLGRRALRLGSQDGLLGEIRQAASEHLHRLHLRTGLVVHLAALQGRDEVFLDKIGGHFAMSLPSKVGLRQRAYRTTGGRAMLAWLPPEEVDDLFGQRLLGSSGGAGWNMASLHQELTRIRQGRGVSLDRGDRTRRFLGMELPSVATAIFDGKGPVAAVCVCGIRNSTPIEWVVPLVVDAAARITQLLRGEVA